MPGGPVCLLPRHSGDGFCRGVWEQLDFLVRAHELREVVLIAHYGCAYYADLLGEESEGCLPFQEEDLLAAAQALRAALQSEADAIALYRRLYGVSLGAFSDLI